jgi:putative peptide zinc metalloprotease protein
VTPWPDGETLPTREDPALALVLVPREADSAATWVFPFDRPAPPEGDDTQALAVATEDGAVVYDVAFALVWADGPTVDTVNEAYAFASCDGCAAVAVSFQVVLVLGEADVVVPQNLSAALTSSCLSCLAYAIASQLVVTLDGEPSAAALAELERIWAELGEFAAGIRDVPLDELRARLEAYRTEILEVLRADGVVPDVATPTPAPAPTRTAVPADPTPAPDPGAPADPAPTPSGTPPPPSPAPDAPTPTPTPTP